jgi:hypothetical protein
MATGIYTTSGPIAAGGSEDNHGGPTEHDGGGHRHPQTPVHWQAPMVYS